MTLSLGFNALVWHWMGPAKALEFLTAYLIEYSLSVDNIFVFVLIFSYFVVPAAYQHRVLFWGILSALVLRGVMIGVGVAFVETFHWALYLFGAFLLFTGAKMFFSRRKAVDIARNPLIRLLRRLVPVSDSYPWRALHHSTRRPEAADAAGDGADHGRGHGRSLRRRLIPGDLWHYARPVHRLYFKRLRYSWFSLAVFPARWCRLQVCLPSSALAIVLSFIGAKMLLADVYHVPTAASLGVVGLVLLAAIGLSLLRKPSTPSATAEPTTKTYQFTTCYQFTMTTDQNTPHSRLSTDLETLHDRLKGKSLSNRRVEASAQRAWLRHAAGPVSVAVLLCCHSRSVHAIRYCHMLDRRIPGDRTRVMAAPLHHASAPVDGPVGPTTKWGHQIGSPAGEICSATLSFPANCSGHATIDRRGHHYCRSGIDVAIADPLLEQHPGLGDSVSGNRDDGEGRLVRLARPFNCYSCLDLYRSDLCIRSQRVPGFLGCFLVMKIDFMTALGSQSPAYANQPLSGAFCGWIHTLLYLLHPMKFVNCSLEFLRSAPYARRP